MMLPILILIPFLGAGALLFPSSVGRRFYPRFAQAVVALALFVLGFLTWTWNGSDPLEFKVTWIPQLGLDFSLWLDGPALFYSWLILAIGFLVLQYSEQYMEADDSPRRFYASLLAFIGSMLGVVVARNLVLLFVFWELTSLTSFLLIGHWRDKKEAILGAQRALLVTGLGGLCLMAGIAVLAGIGSDLGVTSFLEWDTLWRHAPEILNRPAASTALVLMLIGAFAKSAQFPFHFWLPGAMQAPTPVSALLHAATMVKAGVFLIGRLYPIFNEALLWLTLVGGVGVVTMLVGGYLAIFSRDLKQLLAYSTVSQLGLLVAYYGFGYRGLAREELLRLDLLLVASHALFKGGLFMLCGIIDHETGTRDRARLGGLWRKMPVTAALSVLACLSMAGAPFTLGFVAKKLFLEAGLHLSSPIFYLEETLFALAILASAFTVCYSLQFAVSTFFGKPKDAAVHARAHEGPLAMLFAPAFLVVLCVVGGLYVPLIEAPLALLVQSEVIATETPYVVAFFKHADLLFWVSMGLFFVGGPLLFLLSPTLETWHDRLGGLGNLRAGWDGLFRTGIPKLALALLKIVHSPSRRHNTAIVLGTVVLLTGFALTREPLSWTPVWTGSALEWLAAVMVGLALVLTLVIVLAKGPLFRILTLGFIGLLVGGYFVLYKAPDLAITQILVELVLLLMFLNLLPHLRDKVGLRDRRAVSGAGLVLSLGVGVVMGVLSYTSTTSPWRGRAILPGNPTHSTFYLENAKHASLEGGHSGGGANVVNVILVDFRAMDTLGEITVLVVAALGVVVLMRGRRSRNTRPIDSAEKPSRSVAAAEWLPALEAGGSIVLQRIAPLVSTLTLAFAAVLFFVGHNRPGGGFIAGLAGCVAAIPYALGPGRTLGKFSVVPYPLTILAVGLLIALSTGCLAVLFGHPFLHSAHGAYSLPVLGELELASAMLFDFGIFLTVLGVASVILRSFARD
jgi:multicomponent K+:H+ antiporter subunit A